MITAYPLIAAEIEPDIRIFFLNRFPYSLIFGIEGDGIVIIALAHQRRERAIGLIVFLSSFSLLERIPKSEL